MKAVIVLVGSILFIVSALLFAEGGIEKVNTFLLPAFFVSLVLLGFWWVYLYPCRLAKGKSNYKTVEIWSIIGLFTVVGWFIALYFALQKDPKADLVRAVGWLKGIAPVPQPRPVPPPPGAQQTFRVASNGKDLGEFPASAIKQLIEAGKLTMQDYYFDHDSNDWMPLDCLQDLV